MTAFALWAALAVTTADNPVTRLDAKLQGGATLAHTAAHGYLPAVLKALDIPQSSQVLVFSKTSLQASHIGPQTPRALYFNDEVMVGFTRKGEVLEVAAADPRLGTAFSVLFQDPGVPPRFVPQTDRCLACHATGRTRDRPGHLLRSVFPDTDGWPVRAAGGFHTDHTSPLAERWGGWYVTGTHGRQTHLGNFASDGRDPRTEDRSAGQNVTSLRDRFPVADYLTPHSDLVALMVLEHQLEGLNRIARAGQTARDPAARRAAEDVVKYLLFSDEAKLTGPVAGTSGFADEFARRGPFDKQGRSLRQFDLTRRLFRHPCSYLVYTQAFARLPAEMKGLILKRMGEVLSGADQSPAFAHLSAADRRAVREILADTLPGWPRP